MKPDPAVVRTEVEALLRRIGLDPAGLGWAQKTIGKTVFELDVDGRRLIGKAGDPDVLQREFNGTSLLWNAGFRPPSRLTVPEPVRHFADEGVVLTEKAPGRPLSELLVEDAEAAAPHFRDAGQWLATLHDSATEAGGSVDHAHLLEKWRRNFAEKLPSEMPRIERLIDAIAPEVATLADPVPCHADFHAPHIFVDPARLTVIDCETVARADSAFDLGFCLTRTATAVYRVQDTFAPSIPARRAMLESYETHRGAVDRRRLGVFMAMSLLRSLRTSFRVHKSDKVERVPHWLAAAERCLDGDIEFATP